MGRILRPITGAAPERTSRRPAFGARARRYLLASSTLVGALVIALPAPLGAGTLVRADFRGCQVIRVVYRGYPAGTVIDWAVNQFGQPVDRGAFVTGGGPARSQQIISLRVRRPVVAGTDAEFVFDGEFSLRRKPRCTPDGEPIAPVPNGGSVADSAAAAERTPEAAIPITRSGLPAALVILAFACGVATLAGTRRRRPRKASTADRPLPPWLHTPVPKKRSWFRSR